MLIFGHQMARTYNTTFYKSTGPLVYGLVLFLCVLASCRSQDAAQISLVNKNGRATGISIPQNLLQDIKQYPLTISLNGSDQAVLGSFNTTGDAVIFEPLIPLSPGMEYGILQNNRVVEKITVPKDRAGQKPRVVTIYPQADSLPDNLLKLYIQFSAPMQSGNALEHVFLLDKNRDTLDRIFLNLQPELWDTTGTVLTLWIDPGRIKRDLVLNKSLGNPLHKRQTYELLIKPDWKDRHGQMLAAPYSKKFTATTHDGVQPDLSKWILQMPQTGSKQALTVRFNEPLDHYLLMESLSIIGPNGTPLKGKVTIGDKDKAWQFTPQNAWSPGNYQLRADSRLEDLTGNNLNKVFDRDIRKEKKKDNAYYERGFVIKP